MTHQLSKPGLELWTGLSRLHVKSLREGRMVTDRFPDKKGVNYLLVMGVNPDEALYAPMEWAGWEALIVKADRKTWQQFKKKNRRMTVEFKTDKSLIIHVHIWTWDNFKKATKRYKK